MVVAIGNTGSGKSTMLSSIIYGTDALHETVVEQVLTRKKRKGREYVYEQYTKKKKVIDQKNVTGDFKIGHSLASSETFMPHFRKRD